MRLGGFVIHGNNRDTLGGCLDDLVAVCDRVIAIDSQSSDGSADLSRLRNVESIKTTWQGFGAAKQLAASMLRDTCDYLFFLDADERLTEGAHQKLLTWKSRVSGCPIYTVRRRNWASIEGQQFIYRIDTRARLIRSDCGSWTSAMIVHEALPRLKAEPSGVVIDHEFAVRENERQGKDARYALLWAIQTRLSSKGIKPVVLERVAHFTRDLVLGGALFRGGAKAIAMAWRISHYYSLKYHLLRAVRMGAFAELSLAYEHGDLRALFEMIHRPELPSQIEAVLKSR
jgi:(heptosyl)LPS beta-1,4-glucosyltransferase